MSFMEIKTKKEAQEFVDEYMVKGGSPIRVLGSVSDMSDEEFTDSRRNGCDGSVLPFGYGGSDIATIMGKNSARRNLYNRLKFPEKYLHKEVSPYTQHLFDTGHQMEPLIIKRFEYVTGHKIVHFDWQLVNEDYPHFIANVDGLYFDKDTGELSLLEIKCPQGAISQRCWRDMASHGNAPGLWRLIPVNYRYQIYGYMAATRLKKGTIVGNTRDFGLKDIGYTEIAALSDKAAKKLMAHGERFIKNTSRGILPDESDTEDVKAVIKAYAESGKLLPTSKVPYKLPDKYYPAVREYERISAILENADEQIKLETKELKKKIQETSGYLELQSKLEELEATLCTAMSHHENGVITSSGLTYKVDYKNSTKRDFDKTAFKKDYPDLYAKYFGLNKTNVRKMKITKEAANGKD